MLSVTTLLLATGLSISSGVAPEPPSRIDVDCRIDGALERALAQAERSGGADIFLHGTCKGGVVIATDRVTLRGAMPGAGLAAKDSTPVLVEVVNAQVSLRNLLLRGAEIGVLADGRDADVLLVGVELSDQSGGVFARNGAEARLVDSTVRDGDVGVLAQFDAAIRLQNVTVTGQNTGVGVFNGSRASLTDSTIENSRTGGLELQGRCEAFIRGGVFRENSQIHVYAGGRSDITLWDNVILGSETDTTEAAFGVHEHSSIASWSTSVIHGNVTALDRGSLRIGNATVEGRLEVSTFSDALLVNTEIVDGVFCRSGSDVICEGGATATSVDGCPSPTCGTRP